MSSNLLIAFVLLPVLGALIAWAGDVIGYRLGKSRRSLFGLRPRITARLIGAAVGAALPLAGLLFAMTVSQDARDAILRIDELRRQSTTLARLNDELRRQNLKTLQEAQQARENAQTANERRVAATAHLAQTQRDLAASRDRLNAANLALRAALSGLTGTKRDLAGARSSLTQATTNLAQAKSGLTQAKAGLAKAKGDLTRTKADLAQTQTQMGNYQAELANLGKVERDLKAAEDQRQQLEDEVAAFSQKLDEYRLATRTIVTGQVAFEPGDELVRRSVESKRSQEQVEAILAETLSIASVVARRQGIAVGANGRSVVVVSPLPPRLPPRGATEGDIVSEVASQIRQGDAPIYVVVVRAWGRTFKQAAEPMGVEFWVAPNRVIFHAGDVMLTKRVDGRLPRDQVFGAVWQMLAEIRRVSIDRGQLPNPATGHYGEVPAEDILAALDAVTVVGGPALVSAVVASEARVAQPEDAPMLVHLRVERAPPP